MHLFLHACLGVAIVGTAAVAQVGAPRDGGRFRNAAQRSWPGPQVTFPFFLRKAWTSLIRRAGGGLVRGVGGEVVELDVWQSAPSGSVRVHCVPAQHFSGRSLTDGNRRLWAGWVVEGATRRFYHAGDTGYFAGFREIGERLGPIDLAAVPIGAYAPSAMMQCV